MNRKLVLVLVLVVLTVVAGCTRRGGGDTDDPCRCPTLVETAPTIDFIGDGQPPIKVSSNWLTGPRPLLVGLTYDTVDGQLTQSVVAQRMIEAGFRHDVVNDEDHFVADEWEVYVGGARVRVMIVEPDRDAAESLAPLVAALGTVP